MKSFASRRRRNVGILVVLAATAVMIDAVFAASLRSTAFLWGWSLLAQVILLAAYNIRKKLPFLPLGSSAAWLQLHIYAGLLTIVLFGLHVRWSIPRGGLEIVLALLYVAVVASGIIGLAVSRSYARRLAVRGEEVLFERIPLFLHRQRQQVEQLVLGCLAETESTAIPDFYASRLEAYFAGPRHFWHHLGQSTRPRHKLLVEIESYDRYLNEKERDVMQEIAEHVRVKDDLDYQHALQFALKHWLFVHVPLTYALLVFALCHTVMVYAFSGGLR